MGEREEGRKEREGKWRKGVREKAKLKEGSAREYGNSTRETEKEGEEEEG